MGHSKAPVTIPGAVVDPLDGVRAWVWRRANWYLAMVALTAVGTIVALGALWSIMWLYPKYGMAAMVLCFYGTVIVLVTGVGMWLGFRSVYRAQVKDAGSWRAAHLAAFHWYEAWSDNPSGPPDPWWHLRHRRSLQLFVHPDPEVPRYLTQGTDLVVTGGCTADDLRVVTGHLDLLLHRAFAIGVDNPAVQAAIRPVPRDPWVRYPYGWHWEVHSPAAAHRLLAGDLASGVSPAALIAHYRELMAPGGPPG